MAQITRIGAYGVAMEGDKILLIKQKGGPFKDKYDFPGGGIEFGETPENALQREFEEEVAIGFHSLILDTNLSHVLETHSFFQIGMIYRVYGTYSLSKAADFQHYWVKLQELTEENCSTLLWKWIHLPKKQYIDLSHTLESSIPSWEESCGFEYSLLSDDEFCIHAISMKAGVGTHMDAPAHCIREGKTMDCLAMDDMIAPCVVIDLSDRAEENFLVLPDAILDFEKTYGKISSGTFVLIHTGWDRYWNDPEKYQNNFPSVSKEVAELLLARNIAGLGIDTLSPDARESDFPVHKILLGAGKVLIENVAGADQLSPIGSTLFALPLKIKAGTESPLRLFALN